MNFIHAICLLSTLIFFSTGLRAENCEILNGEWEVVENYTASCMQANEVVYRLLLTVKGSNFKETDSLIRSNDPAIYKNNPPSEGTCSINGNEIELRATTKVLFMTVADIHRSITISPDKMTFKGTFTNLDNCDQQGTVSGRRISGLAQTNKKSPIAGGGGEAKQCIDKDYSNSPKGFKFINVCNEPVNLKYTFSKSKAFSDTYSTLRNRETTFSDASEDEKYSFYACYSPNIPQTITGDCIPPATAKTYIKTAIGTGEARDCIARSYTQGEVGYQFINTCPQTVVIKYSLSKNKPHADGYLILPTGAKTSEKASDNEQYSFSACFSPNNPQSLNGKCSK